MAIYHLSAKVFSRKQGHSAVAAAAYRSGETLKDHRIGKTFDYSRRDAVLHTEIMAPDNAPEWATDREQLWNEVEAKERRGDSQVAREVEVALPRELGLEQNVELVRAYVESNFIKKGMVADIAVHESNAKDGDKNPHAHILLTMRELDSDGFGKKNRRWNQKETLTKWRANWQQSVNDFLESNGSGAWVDHRSLESQGVGKEAGIHLGKEASAMERKGILSDRGNRLREIEHLNRVMGSLKAAAQWIAKTPQMIYQNMISAARDLSLERNKQPELER